MKKIVGVLKNSGLTFLDLVAIASLFVLASLLFWYNIAARSGQEDLVAVVTVNLQEVARFDLDADRLVRLENYGVLSINSKKVRVLEANCKDQICVHTKEIEEEGESIICLPNRLIIELQRKERR